MKIFIIESVELKPTSHLYFYIPVYYFCQPQCSCKFDRDSSLLRRGDRWGKQSREMKKKIKFDIKSNVRQTEFTTVSLI